MASVWICMGERLELEYWRDGDWWVGQLIAVPGVVSQGQTVDELEQNIRDAYWLIKSTEGTT
jgi:predicted RNase H-like HicB family nuclease